MLLALYIIITYLTHVRPVICYRTIALIRFVCCLCIDKCKLVAKYSSNYCFINELLLSRL